MKQEVDSKDACWNKRFVIFNGGSRVMVMSDDG